MEWRKSKRFSCYEVSEFGDVRRIAKGIRGGFVGKVMKAFVRADGYRMYILREANLSHHVKAHQLVAEEFLGPKPFPSAEVCHCDGSRDNDHYTNLRWDSRSGNHGDKVAHGTSIRGESHHMVKISREAVDEIRRRYAAGGVKQRELAEQFGIKQPQVSRILGRQRWT